MIALAFTNSIWRSSRKAVEDIRRVGGVDPFHTILIQKDLAWSDGTVQTSFAAHSSVGWLYIWSDGSIWKS